MLNEVILSLFFGLGFIGHAFLLIGKLEKEDIKKIVTSIGGGFLSSFIIIAAILQSSSEASESIALNEIYLAFVYPFFIGFGAVFAMSFIKRILLKINEITLLFLDIILLYLVITRLGVLHPIAIILYVPTIIGLILLLFSKLKNSQKGFLYIWFIVLLIITGFVSGFYITSSIPKDYVYSSYLLILLGGYIFLYIYVHTVYLIVFIPVSSRNKYDIERKRKEVKEHFLQLAASFQRTKINPFLIVLIFLALIGILSINYYYHLIEEGWMLTIVIFLVAFINERGNKSIVIDN